MVPGAGIEPARPSGQGILSPLRLPFRHPGLQVTYCDRETPQGEEKYLSQDLIPPYTIGQSAGRLAVSFLYLH
jgi:hypothetical protein